MKEKKVERGGGGRSGRWKGRRKGKGGGREKTR